MSYGNYNPMNSYGSGAPIVLPTSYANPGNLSHNNLPGNIRQVRTSEYTITIDSRHRDILKSPNPFEYSVSFAPGSVYRVERPSIGANGLIQLDASGNPIMETLSQEVAGPIIREALQFAKFIRVERAILPRLNGLDARAQSTALVSTYVPNTDKLDGDRYTILQIPEFQDECKPCRFGTSQELSSAAAILTPAHSTPGRWQVFETCSPQINFRSARDIRNMTVRLLDSQGKKLGIPGLETCNVCRHHADRANNAQTSQNNNNENLSAVTETGGFILDTGKVQAVMALIGALVVKNVNGAVIITGTLNGLPVDIRIDPHRIVAGTILDQRLNEPVTWSNWNDATISGSIDTKTISFHGSLNGYATGVLRLGYAGVDWWCYIDSSLSSATAIGWTGLYWSEMERSTSGTGRFNMSIANLIQLCGSTANGVYTLGATSAPVQQATADGSTIAILTKSIGASVVQLGTTSININSSIGVDNLVATGTASTLTVEGSVLGVNVTGGYAVSYNAERTWITSTSMTSIPVMSMTTSASGYRNNLRLQGWVGTTLFFSASIRPDMSLQAAIIFQGIPGTVRAEIRELRLVGTFELADGRTGTINAGYTSGNIVVSDGIILIWDGVSVTSSSGTIWNVAVKRGTNWAVVDGDLGSGLGYWDASVCNCQIHPLDPRIQHALIMTVGVHEESIRTDHRPYQL